MIVTGHPECQTTAITVNGEERTIPRGSSVLALLRELGIDPARVAVEYNRSILRRGEWETTLPEPGAVLEVVHFVGGG